MRRIGARCYDREGERISRDDWKRLAADGDYVTIAVHSITFRAARVLVVTKWVGRDPLPTILLRGRPPRIFETRIIEAHTFGGEHPSGPPLVRKLFISEQEARDTHDGIVGASSRHPDVRVVAPTVVA